ncbi:MAG: hypothetical protein DRP65_12110 [Planctomycetota bacterium]|nr:MAG: hypothetical protein DRP65_12110 [Planctomycetota bacterium]
MARFFIFGVLEAVFFGSGACIQADDNRVLKRSGHIGCCAFSDVLVVSSEQIIRRENLLGQ